MAEKHIERDSCRVAEANGWLQRKFVSPGHNGVPDRIFIKDTRVVFIEFKVPGGVLRPIQKEEIKEFQSHGADIYVCESVATLKRVLNITT